MFDRMKKIAHKTLCFLNQASPPLTAISVLAGSILYFIEASDRAEDRLVQKILLRQNAFQVIDRSRGNDNDIGQTTAIEALHKLGTDFSHIDLSGTYFGKVKLPGSNFSFSNLSKSTISGSDLNYSFLHRSNLQGIYATETSFIESTMPEAKFCNSHLSRSKFNRAKLMGADFRGADLSKTDFSDANISGADFSGALLNGANLSSAINLTQKQMNSACIYRDLIVFSSTLSGEDIGTPNTDLPLLPPGITPPPYCVGELRILEKNDRRSPKIDCSQAPAHMFR